MEMLLKLLEKVKQQGCMLPIELQSDIKYKIS